MARLWAWTAPMMMRMSRPGRVLGVVAQVGLARRRRQDLLALAPHVPHALCLDEHVAGQPLQLADHDPVALAVVQGVEDVGRAVPLGGGASGPGRLGDYPDDAVAVRARPGPDGCLLAGVALLLFPCAAGAGGADQPHPIDLPDPVHIRLHGRYRPARTATRTFATLTVLPPPDSRGCGTLISDTGSRHVQRLWRGDRGGHRTIDRGLKGWLHRFRNSSFMTR